MGRLSDMVLGYVPIFISNALAGLNKDPQIKMYEGTVYSSGPGRLVGPRRKAVCRPRYAGNRCTPPEGPHVPKHLRQPVLPKFKGKRPAPVLTVKQKRWLGSHLLPYGRLDMTNCPGLMNVKADGHSVHISSNARMAR